MIVSTIGFPLVGGPAGTMEGGRQAEIAQGILASKNVPYMVAAPLLIQVAAQLGPLQRHHKLQRSSLDTSSPQGLHRRVAYNAEA